jgi:hypothetical protein
MARFMDEVRAGLRAGAFDDVVERWLGHLPEAAAAVRAVL